MTQLFEWIAKLFRELKILVIILPWERAVRVRLGKYVVTWGAGWYLKLPFIDSVHMLNARLRIANTDTQTLTTSDGHALTVACAVGFCIADPAAAMQRLQFPEQSCAMLAASTVADIVTRTPRAELLPRALEQHVLDAVKAGTAGCDFEFVRVITFAYARTIRLLSQTDYTGRGLVIEERSL